MTVTVLHGDCRPILRAREENSVHCFVTSPPYYGLRDYGIEPSTWGGDPTCRHDFEPAAFCRHCGAWRGVLGLEPGWALYVEHVVEVFRDVRRVLRKDGTLWLNVGDSYASATSKGHNGFGTSGLSNGGAYQAEVPRPWSATPELGGSSMKRNRAYRDGSHAGKHAAMTGRKGSNRAQRGDGNDGVAFGPMSQPNRTPQAGFKPKDRMMIPARVAIALCDDGWWLRDEVVWRKPNPMPSSAEDRTTCAHEMVYMLSKSQRYFYDAEAIAEPASQNTNPRGAVLITPKSAPNDSNVRAKDSWHASTGAVVEKRNKRSVWDVATFSFPEAHFATFPPDLVEPCVLAGTSARGCCVVCRTPWRRVTAEVETGSTQKMPAGHATKAGSHSPVDHNAEGRDLAPGDNPVMATVTLGWYPACACVNAPKLPDHPPKPSRAKIDDEDVYKMRMRAWREYAAAIDEQRKALCQAQATTPTVPAVVGDPFGGSGTVGMVADRLQRDALLIDLGKDYVEMARRRINDDSPLFGAAE